jgi:hypothetical protein
MANSTASIFIKPTVAFYRGDTFVFGSWVCTADGVGSFQRRLTMPPNPETGLVTLPEVVTGDLAGKFGEISLYNQHADFELGSDSNSNSTSPWAITCEPAIEPSCADSPLHEHFPYSLCIASKAHAKALSARRAGKETVSEYNSDSNRASGYDSDSNPISGYYSDSSYEFNFGADPDEPESENYTTEQLLSGPAFGLVITSTPAGRFVYWPDRKPADLTDENSCCVAYLNSLPFQEGTLLAPAAEHTPTEVATSDSSLDSLDRKVFMTTNETSGPSGTLPDQYLEDISADELSANTPANETDANRDAQRERNRKWNERRRRLRESLPIRNLAEALDQVENRVHTTPEQCLMSITMIARQAQGMRGGRSHRQARGGCLTSCELTKESLKCPPSGIASKTTKPQVAVELTTVATVPEGSYRLTPTVLWHRPVDLLIVAIVPAVPAATVRLSLIVILVAEAVTAGAPTTGLAGEPGVEATAAAEATRIITPPALHVAVLTPAKKSKNYDAKSPPRQATTMAYPLSLHGFAIYFSRRNSNLWGSPSTTRSKIQYSGSDAMPSPSKTLVAIMTRSPSTSPSAWIKLRLDGSSHSRSTRSTSGTSSRNSSPATSRALWAARVLAWTWQW